MCGIVGFAGPSELFSNAIRPMMRTLVHRGPDDEGAWEDAKASVALGHRRLSVLDLSAEGHQPMHSAAGRWAIVFNGEIYNHAELRAALGDHAWRGHSDTEVLLEAFARWGVAPTLEKTVGMFALALWDKQEQKLYLARDRFGEKPLYYGMQSGVLLFGSELKALRAHPSWVGKINRPALSAYLRYGYVPSPLSIFQGIHKLLPGTWLVFDAKLGALGHPQAYWSVAEAAQRGRINRASRNPLEIEENAMGLLRQIIRDQRMADVPLGTFLSGGIDSTLITALLAEQSERPVRSFTIGFREGGYDEAPYARAVARHLGTDHTELYVSPQEAQAVIPLLPTLYDEPFADSSQIPTYLVSQLARSQVTVALSGDGGDELFGGYNRYFWAPKLWRRIRWLPSPLRHRLSRILQTASPTTWDKLFLLLPRGARPSNAGLKMHKLADAMSFSDTHAIYRSFLSQWPDPTLLLAEPEPDAEWETAWRACTPDFLDQMMAADAAAYLPDDIMVKVDRAAMGVSLETRAPFLDHRLFEFAWHLPQSTKVEGARGKLLLRRLVERYVPAELMDRPKQGFGVPIDAWLRGPLRDWAEALLDERRLVDEGWFNPKPIRAAWREHLSGRRDWQHRLWVILMFQAWQEQWL